MSTERRRYGRQIRLAEIGEAGQAKLCAATVELGAVGFAQTIEERYVRAAGMTVTRAEGERSDATVSGRARERSSLEVAALGLRHPPARDVAEGALCALAEIRAALGSAS